MMNGDAGLNQESRKALLYCRVSSKRQSQEGSGLDSQEHRCRQYADAKGYTVEAVFPDDVSGGGDFMKRPGMVALLAYMDAKPNEQFVVIFDDLKRYARDTEFHLRLRRIMAERGAARECLNFNFENSPEGKFFETIAAAQGELEREQNGRQVTQKMRARVEQGVYCFGPVVGYRYDKHSDGGKILVPDEPKASIIREAFEGLAVGRFQSQSEVKRFLDASPEFQTRGGNAKIAKQSLSTLLRCPLYAGYISIPLWGIHLQLGKHEALVSFAVWKRVQDRLDGRANAPARKDLRADFPLRGFVCCSACDSPMTAAWSKGRNALYPYYVCYKKGCQLRGKSVRKEKVEADFETLVRSLKPAPVLHKLAHAMFTDCWSAEADKAKARERAALSQVSAIDKKIGRLVERVMASENTSVIQAYEKQIAALDIEKAELAEIAAKKAKSIITFDESFRTAFAFLSNPWKLWASDKLEHKRAVLRLAFKGPLAYCRNEGFRTAGIAEPFRVLGALTACNKEMVAPGGLEPPRPEGSRF